MMVDDKSNKTKALFVCGIIMSLCGILMLAIQLHGWAMYGEKFQLALPLVFICLGLGAVMMGVSHYRKVDK